MAGLLLPAILLAEPTMELATQPVRRPVPSAAEQRPAQLLISDLCGSRLKDTSAENRAHLSAELWEKVQASGNEPAVTYCLLEQARQLAAVAGDGPLALQICQKQAADFEIDGLDLQRATLHQLDLAGSPAGFVAHRAVRAALLAIEQDRPALGVTLAQMGVKAARRLKDAEVIAQTDEVLRDAELAQKLMQSFVVVRPTTASATAAAISPQGRYLLLYRGDAGAAAAAFASTADPVGELLKREIDASGNVPALLEIANQWWKMAAQPPGVPAWRIRRQAAMLYGRCAASLSGLQRDLATKRIADARVQTLAMEGLMPGIIADVVRTSDGQRLSRTLEADIVLPAEDLPSSDFAIRCSGYVDAATAGEHEFHLAAGTAAKFVIDGKTLVDDPAYSRKRAGEKFSIRLDPGLHEMLIEIRVNGGKPRLQLTWRPPGAKDFTPIPTTSLYHEEDDR